MRGEGKIENPSPLCYYRLAVALFKIKLNPHADTGLFNIPTVPWGYAVKWDSELGQWEIISECPTWHSNTPETIGIRVCYDTDVDWQVFLIGQKLLLISFKSHILEEIKDE